MKFKLEDTTTLMNHLMLSSQSVSTDVANTTLWTDNEELVATLQINGIEVPATVIEDFMLEIWERANDSAKDKYDWKNVDLRLEKFDQRVEEKANQLLKDYADNALEQLADLTEKLESIGNVLTPSWERK